MAKKLVAKQERGTEVLFRDTGSDVGFWDDVDSPEDEAWAAFIMARFQLVKKLEVNEDKTDTTEA